MTSDDLTELALNFRREPQVKTHFNPFACGGIIDPVAKWALDCLIKEKEIRQLVFLLDWLPSDQVGKKDSNTSLKKCTQYCELHWNNDPAKISEADTTFSMLMWSPWSRDLLKAGHCLPMNSLWGVRTFSNDPMASLIYSAKNEIMMPIIKRTKAENIYVCHSSLREYLTLPNVTNLYHPSTGAPWLMMKGPVSEPVTAL
jgi:hypothetical protein